MNFADPTGDPVVEQALKDLRNRTTTNLQAFNDAVPYTSWLRRSEIERITSDLLRSAETAPRRRRLALAERIPNVFAWITRIKTAARLL